MGCPLFLRLRVSTRFNAKLTNDEERAQDARIEPATHPRSSSFGPASGLGSFPPFGLRGPGLDGAGLTALGRKAKVTL